MGNEQSSDKETQMARRSIDSTTLRQVHSAHSTPRISLSGPRLVHKNSELSLQVTSTQAPQNIKGHRLSVGNCRAPVERRGSKGRLNINGEMGNQQTRRVSRSTNNFSEMGDVGLSLQEHLKLTPYQSQLVHSSWCRMKSSSGTFTQIFKLLCFKSVLAREIFQKLSIVEGFKSDGGCDLNMHSKTLCDLMDSILSDLSQPVKDVQNRCTEVGTSHHNVNEKLAGALWECLGECMAEVITKHDSVRSKREAVKGWITVISFMVDSMKSGYVNEFRRRQVHRGSVTRLNNASPQLEPRCPMNSM